VRGSPEGFLSFSTEHSAMISSDTDSPLVFQDEMTFIKAVDPNKITSWKEFEFLISVLIENRLLRLYQADLEA
jgi:hypothetical protein